MTLMPAGVAFNQGVGPWASFTEAMVHFDEEGELFVHVETDDADPSPAIPDDVAAAVAVAAAFGGTVSHELCEPDADGHIHVQWGVKFSDEERIRAAFGVDWSRQSRIEHLAKQYGFTGVLDETGDERYLLIERSSHGGDPSYCFTTHDEPIDAIDYHDSQEYPGDWDIDEIIDLDTGDSINLSAITRQRSADMELGLAILLTLREWDRQNRRRDLPGPCWRGTGADHAEVFHDLVLIATGEKDKP